MHKIASPITALAAVFVLISYCCVHAESSTTSNDSNAIFSSQSNQSEQDSSSRTIIASYFVFGAIARCVVRPRCQEGISKLLGEDAEETFVNCDCMAEIDRIFCNWYGSATCRSQENFCLPSQTNSDSSYCGESFVSGVFRRGGDFARIADADDETTDTLSTRLFAYFRGTVDYDAPFEIRVEALQGEDTRLLLCDAFVEVEPCSSCTICDDGLSFTADCSNVEFGENSQRLPADLLSSCHNFAFEAVQ
jgi:hypothetical protein